MMPEFFETTATAATAAVADEDEEEIEAVVGFVAETEAVVVLVVLMKEEGIKTDQTRKSGGFEHVKQIKQSNQFYKEKRSVGK